MPARDEPDQLNRASSPARPVQHCRVAENAFRTPTLPMPGAPFKTTLGNVGPASDVGNPSWTNPSALRSAVSELRFGIKTAIEWVRRARETGETAARKQGHPKGSKLDEHEAFLLGLVAEKDHMQAQLRAERGVFTGTTTLWRFFDARGLTFKKKSAHAAEQDRPDVLKRREAWFEGQLDLDPERLVFIDETWASTNMARLGGRAPKGERLRAAIPHGHWKTTTFVAGLRFTGLVAPMVLDGPINATRSRPMWTRCLCPGSRPATWS